MLPPYLSPVHVSDSEFELRACMSNDPVVALVHVCLIFIRAPLTTQSDSGLVESCRWDLKVIGSLYDDLLPIVTANGAGLSPRPYPLMD